MLISPIKNDEEHKRYINQIESLIEKDPEVDTDDGARLVLLMTAIKEYENQKFFFKKPTPIEAIKFRMQEQNLKQKDLIPFIGSKSKVSEVLSGRRNLTVSMIRELHEHLKIPAEILIQDSSDANNETSSLEFDYSLFPLDEIHKRKWITSNKEKLKSSGQKIINEFIEQGGGFPQNTMWRKSCKINSNDNSQTYKLIAWSIRVKILAKEMKVGAYNKELITKGFLKEIAKLSQFDQGPKLAVEKLAKHGIKVIFQKHLSATKLDGGCFLDEKNQPIIGLTLRYDRIDYFWFTLLHELAHVYRHLKHNNECFIDQEETDHEDFKEQEADQIAKECFLPNVIWNGYSNKLHTEKEIHELANKLNIHPGIIAGRIRFETKDYSAYNTLVGQGSVKPIIGQLYNE